MKQLLLLLALISPSFAQLPTVDYVGMFFSTTQVISSVPIRKVSSLPATCTAVGSASSSNAVLYQGRVYQCASTNTWTFAVGQTAALTSGRVPFATAGGLLTDSSSFLIDTSNITLALGTSLNSAYKFALSRSGSETSSSQAGMFADIVNSATSGSAFISGAWGQARVNSGASGSQTVAALRGLAVTSGASTGVSALYGMYGQATHTGSGTVSLASGFLAYAQNIGGGTVSDLRGFQSVIEVTSSSTVTRSANIFVGNPSVSSGGSIGTVYGIYIDNQTGGTTNYAIFSVGGASLLNAGTASVVPLTLRGAASQSANLLELQNSSATALTTIDAAGRVYPVTIAFAALGTPANGAVVYCNDCTKATPCAGSGNGALAKRLNGAWDCD